jgi:hypothetical protein
VVQLVCIAQKDIHLLPVTLCVAAARLGVTSHKMLLHQLDVQIGQHVRREPEVPHHQQL